MLVEFVAVINFFQIKLQLVVVGDGYVRSYECVLVVVKSLAKSGEMFVAVPLCDVEGTPAVVEMLEGLEGGDVAVRREAMLELGIILLVQGIVQVVNNAVEETLLDEPRELDEFPFLLHLLVCVGGWVSSL